MTFQQSDKNQRLAVMSIISTLSALFHQLNFCVIGGQGTQLPQIISIVRH